MFSKKIESKIERLETRPVIYADILEHQVSTLVEHIEEATEKLLTYLKLCLPTNPNEKTIFLQTIAQCEHRIQALSAQIQALTPSPLTQLWEAFCKVFRALFSIAEHPEIINRRQQLNSIAIRSTQTQNLKSSTNRVLNPDRIHIQYQRTLSKKASRTRENKA